MKYYLNTHERRFKVDIDNYNGIIDRNLVQIWLKNQEHVARMFCLEGAITTDDLKFMATRVVPSLFNLQYEFQSANPKTLFERDLPAFIADYSFLCDIHMSVANWINAIQISAFHPDATLIQQLNSILEIVTKRISKWIDVIDNPQTMIHLLFLTPEQLKTQGRDQLRAIKSLAAQHA